MSDSKHTEGPWIKASERLPGFYKVVEWRNADGGNIPLGKYNAIDFYKKVGPNTGWMEWQDEAPTLLAEVTTLRQENERLRQALELYFKCRNNAEDPVNFDYLLDETKWIEKAKEALKK